MGPEGNIFESSPISTSQQGLTHSALKKLKKHQCSDVSEKIH